MKKPSLNTRRLLVGCVVLSSVGLVLSMFAISMGYRAPTGEEQPKITDWMQAWGSIFGVFAGLAAAGAAAWLLIHEREQTRQARAELAAERAEAMLAGPRSVVVSDPMVERRGGGSIRVTVTVHNYGVTPIRAISILLTPLRHQPEILLPEVDVIGPSGQRELVKKLAGPEWERGILLIPTFAVYFRDSSGSRWRRENNLEPERWPGRIPIRDANDDDSTPAAS
ncbi:hypothetical protein ACVMYR_02120 [Micromonospora sp. PTRAS2]